MTINTHAQDLVERYAPDLLGWAQRIETEAKGRVSVSSAGPQKASLSNHIDPYLDVAPHVPLPGLDGETWIRVFGEDRVEVTNENRVGLLSMTLAKFLEFLDQLPEPITNFAEFEDYNAE